MQQQAGEEEEVSRAIFLGSMLANASLKHVWTFVLKWVMKKKSRIIHVFVTEGQVMNKAFLYV